MSTQTTDVAAWLDGLEEARKAATSGHWEPTSPRVDGSVYIDAVTSADGYRRYEWVAHTQEPADAALIVAAINAVGPLVAALRGVLALAEELQGTAEITGGKVNGFVFADRIRAVVAAAHTEEGLPESMRHAPGFDTDPDEGVRIVRMTDAPPDSDEVSW